MKKYESPQVDFITLGSQDTIIRTSDECTTNSYVCTEDSACNGYVCPSMYGSGCAANPYS